MRPIRRRRGPCRRNRTGIPKGRRFGGVPGRFSGFLCRIGVLPKAGIRRSGGPVRRGGRPSRRRVGRPYCAGRCRPLRSGRARSAPAEPERRSRSRNRPAQRREACIPGRTRSISHRAISALMHGRRRSSGTPARTTSGRDRPSRSRAGTTTDRSERGPHRGQA